MNPQFVILTGVLTYIVTLVFACLLHRRNLSSLPDEVAVRFEDPFLSLLSLSNLFLPVLLVASGAALIVFVPKAKMFGVIFAVVSAYIPFLVQAWILMKVKELEMPTKFNERFVSISALIAGGTTFSSFLFCLGL